jgi:hypothetical protein
MDKLFSLSEGVEQDELIAKQFSEDIEETEKKGELDTDELKFEKLDDNKVAIHDKEAGETTIAEKAEDGSFDLYNPEDVLEEEEGQLDGFLHPEVGDQVIPGGQQNPTENVEDHEGQPISPNTEDGGLNPEAGHEKSVEETAQEGPEGAACPECGKNPCECEGADEEEKEFSATVYTNNTAVQRIFSDQEFCERLFSEVLESAEAEDVAKVGSLRVEKIDDDTVVVTDEKTGDAAKVSLSEDELEVEELESKTFSEEGEEEEENPNQFEPLHVVGVDTGNHQLVDSSVFDEEDAQELADRLTDMGLDGVQVIADESDARDYALDLLENLGVENPEEDIEEPEEATFSDHDGYEATVYVTRYYSNNTVFMDRLFSETDGGIETSQAKIEDALENGDEIETEEEIVTPISATEAVVEDKDNNEFTKVTIEDDKMKLNPLTEEEAGELLEDIAVSEDETDEDAENEEEEKDFSDIIANEANTKFFSESEPVTAYMERLFSDEEKEELIEKAIEDGDQIENDTVVITPVDSETAVIEDKENGEFTKAVMSDEDIDLKPISEDEATELTEDLAVSDEEEEVAEEDDEDEKEDEKEFSDSILSKWFAEVVAPAQAAPAQAVPVAAPVAAAPAVDENGQPVVEDVPSVEAIEDKAIAAVQQIQAAAAEAEAAILNAKAAPVQEGEVNLQEAQFSETEEERTFSENDTLVTWFNSIGGRR